MLSGEQNALVTETEAGTGGGALMRRYWQPVALVEELAEERPLVPVKLMGEDLVLFRADDGGAAGLTVRRCPHRGADLRFGRLEERRHTLPVPRLAFRRQGEMPRTAGGTAGQQLPRQDQDARVSLRRTQRCRVRLARAGRAAAAARFRLLRRARRLYLRVQGSPRVQTGSRRLRSGSILRTARSCIASSRTRTRKRATGSSSATSWRARRSR